MSSLDDLWRLSRESVENKALEEWAQKYGHMPQALPVEQRLFKQLRDWREQLSTQLHLHNPHLTTEQVDEVILRFFNRLIFIRTAEDRGLEEFPLRAALHQWQSQHGKGELVEELRRIFRYFDGHYDSELFKLHMADQVFVEGPTIENIIEGLYQPSGLLAAYDFSVIDADVLGAVYEQYLGQVTVIVKQRAKAAQMRMELGQPQDMAFETEANKRRRKEMGIYYTPKWVTDYIVAQTVGRFLKEKTHNNSLNMRVLDPACGSGSFLIRAYDTLLNYHAQVKDKSAAELDQFDRLPILTGNIFGVDLDQQAVEIARLNLLIRSLAKRDILPPLSDNVKQGNSLISGSEAELQPFFGKDWQAKNPFNWEQEFPGIMSKGGFDIVIGNPPYLNIKLMPDNEKDFYRGKYLSAKASFDIYVLFVEKSLELLQQGGRLGFIIPNKFIQATYATEFRQLIAGKASLEQIVDFGDLPVFQESTTYPCILIIRKDKPSQNYVTYAQVMQLPPKLSETLTQVMTQHEYSDEQFKISTIRQEDLKHNEWRFRPDVELQIVTKMKALSVPLSSLVNTVFVGLQITPAEIFAVQVVSQAGRDPQTGAKLVNATSKELGGEAVPLERQLLRPLIKSSEIGRYHLSAGGAYVIFPYQLSQSDKGSKATLIPS